MKSSQVKIFFFLALGVGLSLTFFAITQHKSNSLKVNPMIVPNPDMDRENPPPTTEWNVGMISNAPIDSGSDTPIGWQKYRNQKCGFTYAIPKDWLTFGPLGETTLQSPEDVIDSKKREDAFMKIHPDFVEEGEAPLFDSYSLIIMCSPDAKEFTGDSTSTSIVDFLKEGSATFPHGSITVTGKMLIGGFNAFEVQSLSDWQGVVTTSYGIFAESDQVYFFQLLGSPYEKLPPIVKQVIGTFVFHRKG
jgi:hypothetical protein